MQYHIRNRWIGNYGIDKLFFYMLRGAEQHRLKNNAVKLTVLITCCDYMELPCIHKDSIPLLQFDDAIVKLIEGTPLFINTNYHNDSILCAANFPIAAAVGSPPAPISHWLASITLERSFTFPGMLWFFAFFVSINPI